MGARTRPNVAQLFTNPPNKMQKWNEKYRLVESRKGWNFPVPHRKSSCDGVEKIKITSDVEKAARDALREYLGIQVDNRDKFVAGISQRAVKDIRPWTLMEDEYRGWGWTVHPGDIYLDKYTVCTRENPCACSLFVYI